MTRICQLILMLIFTISLCSCFGEKGLEYGDKISSFQADEFNSIENKIDQYNYHTGSWTVLFFYPADFTYVCPTELLALQKVYHTLQDMHTALLAISVDSVEKHQEWFQKDERISTIQFPLLSDKNYTLSRKFEVYNPQNRTSRRATIILDPTGKIVMKEIVDDSLGRSTAELIRKLQGLIYLSSHPGVCPANWEPGTPLVKVPKS